MSLPRADYAYEKAPEGALKEQAKKDRERSATAYVQMQLNDAKAALSASDYKTAFGIATSLHQHAIKRELHALDAGEIQPVLEQAVLGLIPEMSTEPRKVVGGLLGFLDAGHDKQARELAAKPFADKVAEHDALAEATRSIPAAYLHRAIADYYAFRRIAQDEQVRRDKALAEIASVKVDFAGVSGCSAFEMPLMEYGNKHGDDIGLPARARIEVQSCLLGKVIADEVRRETKQYKKLVQKGTTTTERTGGEQIRNSVRDSSGNEVYSTGTGSYTKSETKTTTTEDVYADAEVDVDVHHVTRQWNIEAVIVVDASETLRVPVSFSTSYEDEQWSMPAHTGSNVGQSFDTSKERDANAQTKSAILGALGRAQEEARSALSRKFLTSARAASGERQVELYAAAAFAGGSAQEAAAELEPLVKVPADDILAAMQRRDVTMESPLAYKLPELPKLSEAEAAQTDEVYDMIEMRQTGEGRGAELEVMGGLQTSQPTRIGSMMGSGATMPVDPSSSYGLVVGARVSGGADPGRVENGVLAGLSMDLRLGYAGGMVVDANLPVWFGGRVNGVGISGVAIAGWNKLGKDKAGDLWVRNSPYVGYGLNFSYVTWGSTDFSGSWTKMLRSERWQYSDPFADVVPPVIGDESRYELKMQRFHLRKDRYDEDSVTSWTLRYASFTGDQKDGRAITLWYGFAIRPK